MLQTIAAGTAATALAGTVPAAATAEPGDRLWRVVSSNRFVSSPMVVDGTVLFGYGGGDRVTEKEGSVWAVETGVEGSSEDSRVMLGTLGHHGNWQYAGQTLGGCQSGGDGDSMEDSDGDESTESSDGTGEGGSADDGGPGFGVGGAIASVGSLCYLLKRRPFASDADE